jgi:hypothetical protein
MIDKILVYETKPCFYALLDKKLCTNHLFLLYLIGLQANTQNFSDF